MQPKAIYGYADSFFLRTTMQTVKDHFNGNMEYLPITMKMSLHDVVMSALRNADLLSGVVFHGGTCLQRMYGWSRFSEDLDFANIAQLNEDHFSDFSREFDLAIRSELKRLGFTDDQIMVKNPKNLGWPGENEPEVRKWSMRVNVGPRNMKHVVNIELANMPSYQYSPKPFMPLSNNIGSGPIMVNVEPLHVIFNDKAISIIQRNFIKYRDIYDVGLLSDYQQIDKELFLSKMSDRKFNPEYVKKRIEDIQQSLTAAECVDKFSAEMSRFIMPGKTVDIANPDIAKSIISKSLEVLAEMRLILDEGDGDGQNQVNPKQRKRRGPR